MAHNWSHEYERDRADYDASAELADYLPDEVVDCRNCARQVIDGTICEACGMPTDSWLVANQNDVPLDGDAESALASIGWGTDEDYGYFGGDEW